MSLPVTDSDARQGKAEDGAATRTQLRIQLPEDILAKLKRKAEQQEISVQSYAAYVLTAEALR